MMPAQTLPRSEGAVFLLLIPTWVAFASVLSLSGALLWVIVPSLIAVQTMFVMISADRRLLAGVVLVALTLMSGALSEVLGGQTSGSITRSTLMVTSCAGLMALLWRTRFPATAAMVALAALTGALGLGAAHRIVWLVGVWVVAVVAYLVAVGPLRSIDLAGQGRLKSLVAILLTAGLLGSVAGNALYGVMGNPWTIGSGGPQVLGGAADARSSAAGSGGEEVEDAGEARGSANDQRGTGKPPPRAGVQSKPGDVRGSEEGMNTSEEAATASASGTASASTSPRNWIGIVALAALTLLGLIILVGALWIAWVQMNWLLLRVRLRRGTPAEQVAGAWHWLRLRWAQSGFFDYVNLTPDRVSHLADAQSDPTLESLAIVATEALYARRPRLSETQAEQSWQNAKTLRARAAGSLPERARACLTTPSAASRRDSEHTVALVDKAVDRPILQ